jgi:hypothetical protein
MQTLYQIVTLVVADLVKRQPIFFQKLLNAFFGSILNIALQNLNLSKKNYRSTRNFVPKVEFSFIGKLK